MNAVYEKTRRRTRRFPVHLPVMLVTDGSLLSGITGDLSLDGANLKLDHPQLLGSSCRIRLGPHGRLSRQIFFCRVVRQNDATVALQFVGRSRDQLRALDVYLTGISSRRPA